jgi:hypothetical protein
MYQVTNYPQKKGYTKEFFEVLNFLKALNDKYQYITFHWSRWEWMFARDGFDEMDLSTIAIFRQDNEIKGLILIEDEPNLLFLIYEFEDYIREEILNYIIRNDLRQDLVVPEDELMINLLKDNRYYQTEWKEPVTKFSKGDFKVPEIEGYSIVSLERDYRLDQIHHALWRGFNHGDDIDYSKENLEGRRHMTSSPNFKKKYTYVAIKDGKYQSYAGIWYLNNTKTALIEPVATVPEHRRKGLAEACILNCIKVAKEDGAKDIFVGSNQPFYLHMGFEHFAWAYRFKKI